MTYPIEKVCDIVEGTFLNPPAKSAIQYILLDSRQVIFPEFSLFFAIKGARQDGHHFIETLYHRGVRNFIVEKKVSWEKYPAANFIQVKNTIKALQKLAAFHRNQFHYPVVGITGSNGKTIVKEWLFQLLNPDYKIVRSPKSYNSQIGVPLSVWQMQPDNELAIFEAGISRPGEMANLSAIIRADIGLLTNIGSAHSESFQNDDEKLLEKLKLFDAVQKLIFCADNPSVFKAIKSVLPDKEHFVWATQSSDFFETADLKIAEIQPLTAHKGKEGSRIYAIFRGEKIKIDIPFSDKASVENAIHCWALMLVLGYPTEVIDRRMAALEPIEMRLEMKSGVHNCLIINDAYNSDLNSLHIALDFLNQQSLHSKKTLILSDILQSGQPEEALYTAVGKLIIEKKISRFIGIGSEVTVLKSKLPAAIESFYFETTAGFLEHFDFQKFSHETILLKGARQFAFEKIANLLAQKVHKTTLEINLDALKNNLNVFANLLNPGVKMMVMVKASGYGSGSAEIARLLEFQNVDYLSVAYADEGVELRKAGIRLPIMVLNAEEATFDALLRYELEPEIFSFEQLTDFLNFLPESVSEFPVHIKLDTGMHRLGFEETEIEKLSIALRNENRIFVKSVFSHLAASENAAHDSFTATQVSLFEKMYKILSEEIGYQPLRHILNSAGIARFPQFQMDMARLGIGLYGASMPAKIQKKLQTVLTLKATISQIKTLAATETVGYGRMGKLSSAAKIATISIGYADGLLRAAGNGKFSALVRGKRAPVVGNVCMDMTMVDVTKIPDAKAGDEVVIFGKELPVDELASSMGTIPYEIFTNIAERVKRIYYQE